MGNLVSRPWDGTALGDAGPYSSADWRANWEAMESTGGSDHGIFNNYFEAFEPTYNASTPNNNIYIGRGAALVNGILVILDNVLNSVSFDANTSGFSRIDRVALEVNYTTQESNYVVIKGTPSASPAIPALTQTGIKWQIPLCYVTLVNNYASIGIADDKITDERRFVDLPKALAPLLQNRQGTEVSSGLGATRGTGFQNAFTLASRNNFSLFGVVQGQESAANSLNIVHGHVRVRNSGSMTPNAFINLDSGGLGVFTPYVPTTDYATAGPGVQMSMETSALKYVDALVFPRHLIFPRFATYQNDEFQISAANTSFARVGSGTDWQCAINWRVAPVFVMAWFVCRNTNASYSSAYRLYNNTIGAAVGTTNFTLAIQGATWFTMCLFGVDFNPGSTGTVTYHLQARTDNAAGNWVTRTGYMMAMELAF